MVALARKLAVNLHRMWADGSTEDEEVVHFSDAGEPAFRVAGLDVAVRSASKPQTRVIPAVFAECRARRTTQRRRQRRL
jgi:hypothetical protein